MSPASSRGRGVALVATLVVAALVLASCGTAKVATRRLDGTPALSISVALSNVGCTLNDVCVAVGTSNESAAPLSVGEFGTPKGNWLNLTLPTTRSPLITSTACSGVQCLLGGSQPGSDLLWLFSASGHALSVATPPPGGIGIDALTCSGSNCALIDTSATGGTRRLSFSTDGGTSWSTPVAITWAASEAITSFSCATSAQCVVGALSIHHEFSLYATSDAGVTWSALDAPSSWTSLTSLSCAQRHCVALAHTSGASLLVRSRNLGASWKSVSLGEQANALACPTATRCVVVGQLSDEKPWLATVHDGAASMIALRYVPTPLLNIACGSKVCAAIGVTTLLSVPSPL